MSTILSNQIVSIWNLEYFYYNNIIYLTSIWKFQSSYWTMDSCKIRTRGILPPRATNVSFWRHGRISHEKRKGRQPVPAQEVRTQWERGYIEVSQSDTPCGRWKSHGLLIITINLLIHSFIQLVFANSNIFKNIDIMFAYIAIIYVILNNFIPNLCKIQ